MDAGDRGSRRLPGDAQATSRRSPSRKSLEAESRRLSARVKELEQERAAMEASRADLEDFVAMAAHEMLKPLVATEWYATLVSERMGHTLDLESRRDLDAMIRISSRVIVLVEALLMDARERHRPLHRQDVDLSAVIRDCVRMFDTEIRTREAHLEIDPMPVVKGDPALLSGVFSNLFANALKYGPRSGGNIRVSVERSEAGWTFAVQSPGPELPEEACERIFDAWELGPGERRGRGSGLGLAIVRHIVERHGGRVGVTSPNNSSNRFFFSLPAE